MRIIRFPVPGKLRLVALLAATVLAACGGGSDPDQPGSGSTSGAPTAKGNFTAVVSFGDSLSDIGSYSPATSLAGNGQPPYFGGKFTTNDTSNGMPSATPLGKVWVENIAGSLGVVVTPAEVGFGATSVKCPAAASPALAGTCTAYGQGGSRITDPIGIGHAGGALTVPLVTQVGEHLARFGSFKSSDLVFVYGGSNDVFAQFGAFTAKATDIQTRAAAGEISTDQANRELFEAQNAALAAMKQAGQELAALVKSQILGKGATYVAVMTLSDISDTPFGNSLPDSVRPVLTDLSRTFNLWLKDGLTDRPIRFIDTFALFKEAYLNPAAHGIVNNTVPACDAAKIQAITGGQVTDGSSLFCNATPGAPYNGLRTGADVNTWQFADGVHPTTGGHKTISEAFLAQLRGFGWI